MGLDSGSTSADTIGFDDFLKIDIRVGTVVEAEPYPEARKPAYKLWVDSIGSRSWSVAKSPRW
jgi:tRNA-binding protein